LKGLGDAFILVLSALNGSIGMADGAQNRLHVLPKKWRSVITIMAVGSSG
jgi:hypothetical protein